MHSYTKLFQPYLLELAEQHRQKQHLSQEHMAELLRITPRSYSALKTDKIPSLRQFFFCCYYCCRKKKFCYFYRKCAR